MLRAGRRCSCATRYLETVGDCITEASWLTPRSLSHWLSVGIVDVGIKGVLVPVRRTRIIAFAFGWEPVAKWIVVVSDYFYKAENNCVSDGFARVRSWKRSLFLIVRNNEIKHYTGKRDLQIQTVCSAVRNYFRYSLQNEFISKIASMLALENSNRRRTQWCYLWWYWGSFPVAVKNSVCWWHRQLGDTSTGILDLSSGRDYDRQTKPNGKYSQKNVW